MSTAIPVLFHFHGELAQLAAAFEAAYVLTRRASVKDAVEALGVPHTEVFALFVDGLPVGFAHLLQPGQRVEVLPAPEPLDVTRPQPLRPALRELRFLADANVGRLATSLPMLGFDVAYDRLMDDPQVAELAEREQRVVLSRDHGLLKRKAVVWGRLIRDNDPALQLREVLRHFGLAPPYRTFSRCLRCNQPLAAVDKAEVLHLLQPKTRLYYQDFQQCRSCGRVYWAGSHHGKMEKMVATLGDALGKGAKTPP